MTSGLSEAEAAARRAARPEPREPAASRSTVAIVRANTITPFNAILLALGILTLTFGDWRDALFLGIIVTNTGIGIWQELRAKQKLDALAALVDRGAITLPDGVPGQVRVERPKNREHGDYATNIALQLAKKAGVPPREFAELLATELKGSDAIAAVDIAGPGFINLTVEAGAQGEVARAIVEAGSEYGSSDTYAGRKINLEFVSANPTGPIHIGGGNSQEGRTAHVPD